MYCNYFFLNFFSSCMTTWLTIYFKKVFSLKYSLFSHFALLLEIFSLFDQSFAKIIFFFPNILFWSYFTIFLLFSLNSTISYNYLFSPFCQDFNVFCIDLVLEMLWLWLFLLLFSNIISTWSTKLLFLYFSSFSFILVEISLFCHILVFSYYFPNYLILCDFTYSQ